MALYKFRIDESTPTQEVAHVLHGANTSILFAIEQLIHILDRRGINRPKGISVDPTRAYDIPIMIDQADDRASVLVKLVRRLDRNL